MSLGPLPNLYHTTEPFSVLYLAFTEQWIPKVHCTTELVIVLYLACTVQRTPAGAWRRVQTRFGILPSSINQPINHFKT